MGEPNESHRDSRRNEALQDELRTGMQLNAGEESAGDMAASFDVALQAWGWLSALHAFGQNACCKRIVSKVCRNPCAARPLPSAHLPS
eukprot:8951086-Alexandrium_andersonii.AAC.1